MLNSETLDTRFPAAPSNTPSDLTQGGSARSPSGPSVALEWNGRLGEASLPYNLSTIRAGLRTGDRLWSDKIEMRQSKQGCIKLQV